MNLLPFVPSFSDTGVLYLLKGECWRAKIPELKLLIPSFDFAAKINFFLINFIDLKQAFLTRH